MRKPRRYDIYEANLMRSAQELKRRMNLRKLEALQCVGKAYKALIAQASKCAVVALAIWGASALAQTNLPPLPPPLQSPSYLPQANPFNVGLGWQTTPFEGSMTFAFYIGTNALNGTNHFRRIEVTGKWVTNESLWYAEFSKTNFASGVTNYIRMTERDANGLEGKVSNEIQITPRPEPKLRLWLYEGAAVNGPWLKTTNSFEVAMVEPSRFYRILIEQ